MRFNANGTRTFHRSDFYLVSEGVLTSQELILFEFLVNQMGFDPEHEDRFGVVEVESYKSLASFLRYSSENAIRPKVAKLVSLGLLIPIGKRRFRVAEYKRYLAQSVKWGGLATDYTVREKGKSPKEVLQSIGVKVQTVADKVQLIEENSQLLPESSIPRYLSSSKVKSNALEHQQTRSMEEYQEIMASGQYQGLTVDDMQWIDSQKFQEIEAALC